MVHSSVQRLANDKETSWTMTKQHQKTTALNFAWRTSIVSGIHSTRLMTAVQSSQTVTLWTQQLWTLSMGRGSVGKTLELQPQLQHVRHKTLNNNTTIWLTGKLVAPECGRPRFEPCSCQGLRRCWFWYYMIWNMCCLISVEKQSSSQPK